MPPETGGRRKKGSESDSAKLAASLAFFLLMLAAPESSLQLPFWTRFAFAPSPERGKKLFSMRPRGRKTTRGRGKEAARARGTRSSERAEGDKSERERRTKPWWQFPPFADLFLAAHCFSACQLAGPRSRGLSLSSHGGRKREKTREKNRQRENERGSSLYGERREKRRALEEVARHF